MNKNIFENLFVLEIANNHWGSVDRGLKIIEDFAKIIRFNNVYAAMKIQIRDVDAFIHKDFKSREDIKYIKKTIDTKMLESSYEKLIKAIKSNGCITMATPFDEKSVDVCVNLGVEIIKIASSDINDWVLIEKIATTKKPVIVSTGGSSLKNIDDLVTFFENRNIPLAINHCVSLYPTEKSNLELNQIDFMKNRYPNHTIGFSTHECNDDIELPIVMAYAKGARTFERHVDIEYDDKTKKVSVYCSTPSTVDKWIKAFKKAQEICGGTGCHRRLIPKQETQYLDALVRGVYCKKDLPKGHKISDEDIYLAVPLQKGQISCKELMMGEVLLKETKKDAPIKIDDIDSPYAEDTELKETIYKRGL